MPRIKQRYLEELEHEFATTGKVILHERPIRKTFMYVVAPISFAIIDIVAVGVLYTVIKDQKWLEAATWLVLALFLAYFALQYVFTFKIIPVYRYTKSHGMNNWIITRDGVYPPNFTKKNKPQDRPFITWNEINDIFPTTRSSPGVNRPPSVRLALKQHTINRLLGKTQYYRATYNSNTGRHDAIELTQTYTQDRFTLAEFLKQCKERYSHNPHIR